MESVNLSNAGQILIAAAVLVNILISSGALIHLVSFARGYGKLEQTVAVHDEEIKSLRMFSHELRDGKIPVKARP